MDQDPRIPRESRPRSEIPIAEALARLEEGGLVVLPTETVYGIAARPDRPEAVRRLRSLKGGERPFTLHLAFPEQAAGECAWTVQARRLARRFWPGPMTLVLPVLRESRFEAFARDGRLGLRVVGESPAARLLAACPTPLLMTSANLPGGDPARRPSEIHPALREAAFVLEAGDCPVGKASSVVAAGRDGRIEILREGGIETTRILAAAVTLCLFVCTGNTCRSPMAEALARREWARRLGVDPPDLPAAGLMTASAGCAALPGQPAAPEAVAALAALGIDLGSHRSRPLEDGLLARASRIYAMSEAQVRRIRERLEESELPLEEDAEAPRRLDPEADLPDPLGGDLELYLRTRDRILEVLPPPPSPLVR